MTRPSELFILLVTLCFIICQLFSHGNNTYIIHNWPLQSFSHDYGLASHTTHVVCVNLYVSGGIYSLTSTPNNRLLRNFFMAVLFTLRVCARNLLRGNRRRNIFSYFTRPLTLTYLQKS